MNATIAIVTRDRREELRLAVRSALAQEEVAEVLVLDDGSRDGTSQMLRDEFPQVHVVRFDDDADVAARRNDIARLAIGDVIVSIDDDAVFSAPRIVADTLRDFDHPRIAAVAIPYIDVGVRPEVQQRAPDHEGRWVSTIFRATAYAIRRDTLDEIGGYTPEIGQFGEEWDLSLKLLDAGYVIRLGRSDPIHHRASSRRDGRRMAVYYRRNELLICWLHFPFPWNILYGAGYAIRGLTQARPLSPGPVWHMLVGVSEGVRACAALSHRRRPIRRLAFRVDQRSRSRTRARMPLRLDEIEAELERIARGPRVPGDAWPRAARPLHAPLRAARTKLMLVIGRPVRCEVCGEVLFRALPFVRRGRLTLLGAESGFVRADWDKMNRMTFRHVEIDRCRPR